MKIFLDTFWKAGLPFGIIMSFFYSFLDGWIPGVITGIAAGCLFGALLAGFVVYQSKKFTKNRPLMPDEHLIKEGVANHFVRSEAVGGWIYLTDRRFFFRSHGANVQNHEFIVPVSEIADVEKGNTFLIIPNQLRVRLENGNIERFVVKNAGSWVAEIQKMKN